MARRLIWGLYDSHRMEVLCFFEAENLLVGYRELLLRAWWDSLTRPFGPDTIVTLAVSEDIYNDERDVLLDLGWERWRNAEVNKTPTAQRYQTRLYELWNSTPPNVERVPLSD